MKTYISIIHLLPFIGQFRDVSHEMLRYAGYYDKKSYIFGLERRDITGKLKYRWLNNAVTDWLAERAFRKSRFWTMMARISFSATLIPDYNYRQQQRILKELFIGLNPEFGEKETEDLIKNAFFKGKEVDAQGKEVDYLDNLIANIDEAFGPGTFAELDLMMERKQFRQAQVLLWEKNYSRIINGYSEDAQQVIQEKLGQEQLEKILDDLEAIIIKNNRKMRISALSRQIDTSLRTLKEMLSVHLRAEDIASQKAKERIDKLISKNGFEKKQKERGYLPRLSLFKSLLVLMAMGSPLPTQEKKTEIEDLEGEARFLALPSYVKKKIDKAFRALSIELEKLRRNVNEKRNLLQRRMLSFAFLDITEVDSNTRENSNKNPKNSKSNKNLIRHLAPLFLYSSIIQPKNIKPADIIIAKRDKDRVNVLRTMTASASEAIKSIWPTLYRTFARLCLFWVVAFRAIFSPSQRILAGNKLFVNENLGNAAVLMAMGSPLLKNEGKDENIFLVFPFSFGMLGNIADKIKTWWSDRPFEKSVKAGKIVDSFARITNEQVLPTQETTNEPFAHFSSRALDDNEKFERLDRVQQRLKESLKEPLFLKAYYSPPAGYINHPAINNKSRITVKDDFSALLNFAKKSLTNAATIKSLTISSIILLTISLLLLEKSPSNVPLLISVFIFVIAISKSPEYKLPQVKTSVKEGLGKALLVLMAMGSPLPKTASGEKAILQRLRENLDNPAHLISLLKELSLITERKPQHPVESRYPVLKAVALLKKEEQERLKEVLIKDSQVSFKNLPLINSLLLMLGEISPAWLKGNASLLSGRRIYQIAAEIWHPGREGGGLKRVMQYHGRGIKRLIGKDAELIHIEPFYPKGLNKEGEVVDVPWNKSVKDIKEFRRFPVKVGGRDVEAVVYRGKAIGRIPVYLIRDKEGYYVNIMYTYGGNYTSWEDFSEFFSRASLKLISILEEKAQEELTEKWKPAVIHSNDGQTALVNTLRFLDEFKDKEVLKDALFWFTTHSGREVQRRY